ncbi:hypothetical protein H4582DRAFT_1141731 [Lactarius indigo]|nr:hypothetical protein H4582DRAFT_1141731 [Lactarius indigo]
MVVDVRSGALREFSPAQSPGTTRYESSGPGSGASKSGAPTGDDGYGSMLFFIYVIGSTPSTHSFVFFLLNDSCRGIYYPLIYLLVAATDPLDSFGELAELLRQVKP